MTNKTKTKKQGPSLAQLNWSVLAPYFSVPARARVKSPADLALQAALASERGKDAAAMRKAKKLAAAHSIDIERERAGQWWVMCEAFQDADGDSTEDDPCEGSHFCSSGREVLEAVEAYVEAITKKGGAA